MKHSLLSGKLSKKYSQLQKNLPGNVSNEILQENMLIQAHLSSSENINAGRNITAGYVRGVGIQFGEVDSFIKNDPIYQESYLLSYQRTMVSEQNFINLFLIMKYGMKGFVGDIIEFGSFRGGSAIFIANTARRLGLKSTIYALDSFEGMPQADNKLDFYTTGDFDNVNIKELTSYIREIGLDNLVLVKGPFQSTIPNILNKIKSIILAHIDCDLYSAVQYALSEIKPLMNPAGGYIVLDDPLVSTCLGALQAVEEGFGGYYAEQAYPHLVYRYPKML